MRNGCAVIGPNRSMYGLIYLAMFLLLGHHIDHMIRGNHVGWPLTAEVTPFTYSLGVYPLILLGLYLYGSGKVGPGYWALLSGLGALFVAWIHFGPAAVEPPADIRAGHAGWPPRSDDCNPRDKGGRKCCLRTRTP
jgi:hypothetical protein